MVGVVAVVIVIAVVVHLILIVEPAIRVHVRLISIELILVSIEVVLIAVEIILISISAVRIEVRPIDRHLVRIRILIVATAVGKVWSVGQVLIRKVWVVRTILSRIQLVPRIPNSLIQVLSEIRIRPGSRSVVRIRRATESRAAADRGPVLRVILPWSLITGKGRAMDHVWRSARGTPGLCWLIHARSTNRWSRHAGCRNGRRATAISVTSAALWRSTTPASKATSASWISSTAPVPATALVSTATASAGSLNKPGTHLNRQ